MKDESVEDDQHWAHVRHDPATSQVVPHHLEDHLRDVAVGAAKHADGFGADWARFAGLWHDLGKYREGFTRYTRQANAIDAHIEGRVKIATRPIRPLAPFGPSDC